MQTRLTALIAFLFAAVAPAAQALVIVNAVETGGDVVFSGGGTLNLAAWSDDSLTAESGRIRPSFSDVVVGPLSSAVRRYQTVEEFTGAPNFGSGGDTFASSGTGDIFGILGAPILVVPVGYDSGDPLSGSATYTGATFASLGMDLGTYTWSWNGAGGANADSFTLNVVPEPSTAALTALGLLGLVARRRRS